MTIEFLTEDKQGKNLHLEHLEDEILNFGVKGGRASIEFLRSLRNMLSGASRSSVNMTVKWDGAPAVFAGIDPADNKFFVAKKSVFNVTPKLYKTNADIDADTSGDLSTKLKVALKEFSKLGIKGVLQGDLMFTKDSVESDTIDGVKYHTFQPNTIVYAVPIDSDLGKTIKSANIGVVWHTTYSGKELQGMKASFGVNISSLTKSSKVWMDDASYKDTSGKSTFTAKETEAVTALLSKTGVAFQNINVTILNKFLKLQESLSGKFAKVTVKTYNNKFVRQGVPITNPSKHAQGYLKYVTDQFDDETKKIKTPAKKQEYETRKTEYVREFKKHVPTLIQVFTMQKYLVEAKMLIVKKLNSIKQLTDTFVRTADGFKVTNPEGYVAIDRISGNAVKLVDRMEFSFNNFTAIKSWDK